MTKMRLFLAALAVSVLACSKGSVGSNPGAVVSIQADPNGTFASVQANGAINEVPGNVTHFLSAGSIAFGI